MIIVLHAISRIDQINIEGYNCREKLVLHTNTTCVMASEPKKAGSIYEFSAMDIDGNEVCP